MTDNTIEFLSNTADFYRYLQSEPEKLTEKFISNLKSNAYTEISRNAWAMNALGYLISEFRESKHLPHLEPDFGILLKITSGITEHVVNVMEDIDVKTPRAKAALAGT